MLKLRILTALVLIPLVIWGIFALPHNYFTGVVSLLMVLASWEWTGLIGWQKPSLRILYVFCVALACVALLLCFYLLVSAAIVFLFTALVWMSIAYYFIVFGRRSVLPVFPQWLVFCLGLLILTTCWAALITLHQDPKLLLFMLVVVWLTDTFAYFGGRLWGKCKLAPAVSPNKTWEGLVCGVIGATGVAAIIQWYFITPHELSWQLLFVVALTVLVSVIGDLFESLLKRQQNLKDSGNLLPGHGGILDRIDSLLAAAPVFAAGLLLITNLL